MKKMIIAATITASTLLAEVTTVVPYAGSINYGSDSATSLKDKATLVGLSMSTGDLDYLLEGSYSHIATNYKDSTIEDLSQDDFTLVYGKYYTNYMFKIGGHYISTNDPQLKDGFIAIASIGGYQSYGKDKLNAGVEGYYSYYKDAHDENYLTSKSVAITQITPYFSFYHSIDEDWGNTFAVKANFQIAGDYVQDSYVSYEISDTLFYKSIFATFRAYGGEMRTGVKDGGMTVYNTLDLMKSGYDIKLGYYFSKNAVLSLSYGENTYREFDQTFSNISADNTNTIALVSFSYSF